MIPNTTASPRWGRIIFIVGVILALPIAALYCSADHQRFLAFDAQREAWHRRCDIYVGQAVTTPAARACAEELQALTAYAKQQGW